MTDIIIEFPQNIFVRGIGKHGTPVIRRYVLSSDGLMNLSEEYPKNYPKIKEMK